jgi:hypothetical protein
MLAAAVAQDGVFLEDPREGLQEGGAADEGQALLVPRFGQADPGCDRQG